jgi:hypothetical protein
LHSNGSHHFYPGTAPLNGSAAHTPVTTNSASSNPVANIGSNNINSSNGHMLFDLRAAAEQQLGQVRRHTHDWQGSYPPSSFEQGGALLNNSAAEACKRARFYFINCSFKSVFYDSRDNLLSAHTSCNILQITIIIIIVIY